MTSRRRMAFIVFSSKKRAAALLDIGVQILSNHHGFLTLILVKFARIRLVKPFFYNVYSFSSKPISLNILVMLASSSSWMCLASKLASSVAF